MKKLILTITILLLVLLGFAQTTVTDKMVIVHRSWGDYVLDATGASVQINGADSLTIGNRIFYIDPATGDDTNTGLSTSLAWRTVDRADTTLTAGDIVALKRGQEHSGTITVNSSGTASDKISYTCYGPSGAKPVLKGTTEVTGWTLHSGNIYKATISEPTYLPNQLFVNDELIPITYLKSTNDPTNPYLSLTSVASQTQVGYNPLTSDYTGAYLAIRTAAWGLETREIISTTSDTTLTLASAPNYTIAIGEPFWIFNSLNDIKAGTWCFVNATNTIYIWLADGSNPAAKTVEISSIENGITIAGLNKKYVNIKNLNFRGYNNAAVYITDSASNVSIFNNTFESNYNYAINSDDENNRAISSTYNTISGSNAIGIRQYGNKSTISNNTIRNQSLVENIGFDGYNAYFNSGMGILCYNGDSAAIKYNVVDSIGYNGIHNAGNADSVMYNNVSHACLILQDGAGIYSHLSGTNSYYAYNISHDNGVTWSTGVEGMYFDNTSDGQKAEYNILYNNNDGLFLHAPVNITANNNTAYNNSSTQLLITPYTGANQGNVINNNKWVSAQNGQYTASIKLPGDTIGNNTMTGNGYYTIFGGASAEWAYSPTSSYKYYNLGLETTLPTTLSYTIPQNDVISILSENYIANPTFNTNIDNWYISSAERVVSSDIGTGGAVKIPVTTYSLRQSYGISIPIVTSTDYMISYDAYTTGLGTFNLIRLNSTIADYFTHNATPTHYEGYFNFSDSLSGNRMDIGVYGMGNTDSVYFDNFSLYEVELTAIDQEAQSQIFVNSTVVPEVQDLGTSTWKDLADNPVTSLTLQPFTSQILISYVDTMPPVIINFVIPDSSDWATFNVTTLTASYDATEFLITETSTTPSGLDVGWAETAPTTYTANSIGQLVLFSWVKDADGYISNYKTDTIEIASTDEFLGNNSITGFTTGTTNAQYTTPFTTTEAGSVKSIVMYHGAGTADVMYAIYADNGSNGPGALLGVTTYSAMTATAGWEKKNLITPVTVVAGQKIWVSHGYSITTVQAYWKSQTAGRVWKDWPGSMTDPFGAYTVSNYTTAIYVIYTPE